MCLKCFLKTIVIYSITTCAVEVKMLLCVYTASLCFLNLVDQFHGANPGRNLASNFLTQKRIVVIKCHKK